ncbi:MAG: thiamine pyrophosphate-binding protein [Proteobacteria bacterium]|nr:thiamine pyrophosphate-binding protein [Pseudomonadota bacterium]
MKYSDYFCQTLKDMGFTHCFTVTGGNIMHIIGSASNYFEIIPVVNEVAAGIAAEYFNEVQNEKKAFALVTAGPGLTNIVTACAGAFLESRDLLIIGGQVKTSDLKNNSNLRQRGIQEIDGVELMKSITKLSLRMNEPMSKNDLKKIINFGLTPKKGPIFLEIPLDVSAKEIMENFLPDSNAYSNMVTNASSNLDCDIIFTKIKKMLSLSERPLILLGGGVSRDVIKKIYNKFSNLNIPITTTWNAADRIDSSHPLYFGRPNNWGQRYSNIIMQQSDLLIAIGTRLGIQQTGFNWQGFIPSGKIIQIDCDNYELEKGHPRIDLAICADANYFLEKILDLKPEVKNEWINFCNFVKSVIPLNEKQSNNNADDFISPFSFVEILSNITNEKDIIIPCSSGGAFTVMMQCFNQKIEQKIITNKALASMGYGLSGAIGASIANPKRRTILVEGDGGFAQNLQEIATAVANNLNLKIFIFENSGYASIRMTQKNYFKGKYVGCDTKTGLGFPNWFKLFDAYGIETFEINDENFVNNEKFIKLFNNQKCVAFIVRIDPEQTYFPKISSKIKADGSMESNPLHLMSPELEPELAKKVFKYINYEKQS